MKTLIEEYIKNSRIEKRLTKNYSDGMERYRWIYANILKHLEKDCEYPELVLCYTLKKTCEQVRINSNTSYLIYDMALGRFMSYLDTLLLFPKTTKNDVDYFLRRCYAELYYSSGKYTEVLLNKLYLDELKSDIPYNLMEIDFINLGRTVMVLLQEIFVLLHEISHFRLRQLSLDTIINNITDM